MSQVDKQAKYKGEACEELLESPDRMARKLAMEVRYICPIVQSLLPH
jgi:hypothetical protein